MTALEAVDVQMIASQGCTAAVSRPVRPSMALAEERVWFTPHRLHDMGPCNSRCQVCAALIGLGVKRQPTCLRAPALAATMKRGALSGRKLLMKLQNSPPTLALLTYPTGASLEE